MSDIEQLTDSDGEFVGVNNRVDSADLKPTYVSKAINRIFDNKVIKNRWGVIRPAWGGIYTEDYRTVTASSSNFTVTPTGGNIVPAYRQISSDRSRSYVISITVSNAGTGMSNGTFNIAFSGGGGSGAAGTFVVSGGSITSTTITSGGTGYTSAPTVSFNAAGGSGHAGTANMRAHRVYPNGTYVSSDDNSNVVVSAKSIEFNSTANLYFFDELTAFTDIVGTFVYREPISKQEVILVACNTSRSDGGQGVIYAIRPSQSHRTLLYDNSGYVVSLNGYDFYSTVRFIQCGDGVVLLRHGPARYYFTGSSSVVDATNDTITLSVSPDFTTGDKVLLTGLGTSPNLGASKSGTVYYASVSGAVVKLYNTRANAVSGGATGRIDLSATTGSQRYYLQVVDPPVFWNAQQTSNVISAKTDVDAPPLIMQATTTQASPLRVGFTRVPSSVSATAADSSADTVTAANHRFVPGDQVTVASTGIAGLANGNYYVYPTDPHTLRFFTSETDALVNSGSTLVNITGTGTATLSKTGVSGSTMPNIREGIYFGNRLIGVYGPDLLAVSDVLNPLVYLPLQNEFRANRGTNDRVVALYPFNETTIIIFKERSILALQNVYGDLSSVVLSEVTRDYGCVAALSIASTGSDIVWLSQRGVVTIKQTQQGIEQSVVVPLSESINNSIRAINMAYASDACGAYFDNKYLCSVPTQTSSTNQITVVFNFLTGEWDGGWTGSYLIPRQYEKTYVNGTQRLIFSDNSGYIHYFDPRAFKDRTYDGTEAEIQTEIIFRAHTCGQNQHKQWTDASISGQTWNAGYTITLLFDVDQEYTTLKDGETTDRESYTRWGVDNYVTTNANDDFFDPHREDYSLIPSFKLKSNGVAAGIFTGRTEKARLKGHSVSVRLQLLTTRGSFEVWGIDTAAIPFRMYGGRDE